MASSIAEPTPRSENESDRVVSRAVAHLISLARERYNKAMINHDDAELERAHDALRIAFTLAPEPELILNLAQVDRNLGRCLEARELYGRYLASKPTSAGAKVAQHHLLTLGNCEDEPDSVPSALVETSAHQTLQAVAPIGWRDLPLATPRDAEGMQGRAAVSTFDVLPWGLAAGSLVSGVLAGVFFLQADTARHRLSSSTDSAMASGAAAQGKSAQNAARLSAIIAGTLGVAAGISFWFSFYAQDSGARGAPKVDDLASPSLWAHMQGSF